MDTINFMCTLGHSTWPVTINDLPDYIHSSFHLFADDYVEK